MLLPMVLTIDVTLSLSGNLLDLNVLSINDLFYYEQFYNYPYGFQTRTQLQYHNGSMTHIMQMAV